MRSKLVAYLFTGAASIYCVAEWANLYIFSNSETVDLEKMKGEARRASVVGYERIVYCSKQGSPKTERNDR